MLLTKKPVIRVIPGPDPNQYGIIGKPYVARKDHTVDKNQKLSIDRNHQLTQENELQSELLKINFFDQTDRKSKYKLIKRTVDEIMNQREFIVTERRNRLKQLLYDEEQNYDKELETLIETPLERASRLRERAKKIKEEREIERKQFIEEKLDQKWRSECDELRMFHSKYLQSEMRLENLKQMEENVEKERQRMEEEAMYADLWHKDMIAKKEKEENDYRKAMEKNIQTATILKEQIFALEKQKEEEKQLKIENARLAHERVEIEKLEKKMEYQNKLRQQATRREELDQNLKIKLHRAAKLAQEELSFDLKLLEEALASYEGEERDKVLRKRELHEEGRRYREYLRKQLEEEKLKEKEMEKIIDADIERQYQKRLNQWKAEKEARKRLLEEVIRDRKEQIEYKIRRNEEEQEKLKLYQKELNDSIENYKKIEQEEKDKLMKRNKLYKSDLLAQMEYKLQNKEKEQLYDYIEYQSCIKAEEDYKKKLSENLENFKVNHLHPIRNWKVPNYEAGSGLCCRCKSAFNTQKSEKSLTTAKSDGIFCKCPIVYYGK